MFKKLIAAFAALLAATAFAAVDANKATQAELESIKGIGPSISGAIVAERKKGEFKDWNDLVVRVKGVGETNAAKLSDAGLTVHGRTFAGAPPAATKPATPAATAKPAAPQAAATTAKADTAATPAVAAKAASAPVKAEKATKAEKTTKADKAEKAEKTAKAEKTEKTAKADKVEKPEAKATAASAPKK